MTNTINTIDRHAEMVEQAKAHLAADMLIKGTYGEGEGGFRGCSVGCHLHHIYPDMSADEIEAMDNKHRLVADYYGYPEWLALLQDTMFEGLPSPDNMRWHVQLAEAIASRNGEIDWQQTFHRVHLGLLRTAYATTGSAQDTVEVVMNLHERAANGEEVSDDLWSAAGSAAWSAAATAAGSAARSAAAAWWAARWAAGPAEGFIVLVAGAAGGTGSAAKRSAYQEMRDAILDAIKGKVTK